MTAASATSSAASAPAEGELPQGHGEGREARASSRAFVLRKLHSLSGVVPVGVFLVEHLWTNAKALGGQAPFDRAVAEIQSIPALPVVEIFGIFLPLAFHAGYGVAIALASKANVGRYPYARNWLYTLQRVTGLVALVFIAWHLYEYRVQKWLFGMQGTAFYSVLSSHLSATAWSVPWMALAYLVGIGATVFHFANGLWGFSASWGITVSRPAQQRAAWVCGVIGAALFVLGANTVIYFATGSRLYGGNDYVPLEGQVGGECATPNRHK
jgi:succinate dehydrogenase/fumarate reductase cytochrome b subunit (b558 family)